MLGPRVWAASLSHQGCCYCGTIHGCRTIPKEKAEVTREPSGVGMDTPTSAQEDQSASGTPSSEREKKAPTRAPSIIVGIVAIAVAALSVFYLVRPEPLLVQGEADATRLDIAARVDGRVKEIPVQRGQNVAAGAVLVRIDNPETLAKHAQMTAAKAVADAQLA